MLLVFKLFIVLLRSMIVHEYKYSGTLPCGQCLRFVSIDVFAFTQNERSISLVPTFASR